MGNLKKLLRVSDLSDEDVENLLILANKYMAQEASDEVLRGKVIVNLFFESSTRTLLAFEIAEKALGAISVTLNVAMSSICKGESISDTMSTMAAMGTDLVVVRSDQSCMVDEIAKRAGDCLVINAGDGNHEHPTQAITDYATIRSLKGGEVRGLKVAICGDVFHSRVARSNIRLLSRYGADIRVVTPMRVGHVPDGVSLVTRSLEEGIEGADVIMLLRIQRERMTNGDFMLDKEYSRLYMLDEKRLSLAKDDVIVMHPGPMNRGVEISDEVADNHSSVLFQVKVGAAVRKAVLHYMLG
ncbi:aspartate carbamoyltransferase [Anaplasma marginale str. Dawn]|uniref:aspartate carbamoyltransferase catalytic subunit n=1 Tax=Anaplasma marginale TaxID=770 RepID=UPI0003C2701D|nr:aspartate carbamoyltransferase catalytic subunit [Anaplasma marginale]AGZ78885.1 aspartate carbamoyltransferase [Anaplasma marginale str. Gypsy Plains]AGZ79714.1 aspartate carbamoyltransferase [Anaplasma marginale str. Dawn]RCL19955.1 aspartate carbamoyltransferase catalytic subunit [Anaplasma marginale]